MKPSAPLAFVLQFLGLLIVGVGLYSAYQTYDSYRDIENSTDSLVSGFSSIPGAQASGFTDMFGNAYRGPRWTAVADGTLAAGVGFLVFAGGVLVRGAAGRDRAPATIPAATPPTHATTPAFATAPGQPFAPGGPDVTMTMPMQPPAYPNPGASPGLSGPTAAPPAPPSPFGAPTPTPPPPPAFSAGDAPFSPPPPAWIPGAVPPPRTDPGPAAVPEPPAGPPPSFGTPDDAGHQPPPTGWEPPG